MKRNYGMMMNYKYNNPNAKKKRHVVNTICDGDDNSNINPFEKLAQLGEIFGGEKKEKEDTSVYAEDNHIYFISDVTSESIDKLIKIIREQNREFEEFRQHPIIKSIEPKPIYLHITSDGGCLFSSRRAIDIIERSKIPIYTVIDGHAASAGTLMSVVGKKRFMTPNSRMLIHQLSAGTIGTFWEMKDEFENFEDSMEWIFKLYERHSLMSREELEKQLSHDTWWDAKKCLEVGLIDDVYTEGY